VNTPANEQHPAISKNRLSLYISSDRPGGNGNLDIYVSQRKHREDPWGPPVNLGTNINSSGNDLAPAFSRDGHWLYFHSTGRGGCGGADLFVSYRNDVHDDFAWEPAKNLDQASLDRDGTCVVNSSSGDAGPTIFEDEETGITTLYFTSTRPGGLGDFDVYQSVRARGEEEFGPALPVVELNGRFRDTRTAIRRDGLELFLSSDSRERLGGFGSQDIWVSTRGATTCSWSTPVNLGGNVNTADFDGAPALSFDASTLYFYSARPHADGSVDNDLYVSTRNRIEEGDGSED